MWNKDKLIIKIIIGLILFIIVAGYSYYEFKDFLTGPNIEITSPENGAVTSQSLLTIEGTAKNISKLFLNDKQIFTDEEGYFNEELLLSLGYNIIEVKAEDSIERETRKRLEIIYK